ncbi:hypothetical protein ACTM83_08920 [Catenibacterium mitsuokai]|uniref:hypothetical protein n=1 Tax=Catenibacterium mitsuokai TaxID=100886 RepID=UPI003F8ADDEE
MINAEKFRKELLELSNQNIAFAVRRENQNAVVRCDSIKRCTDCLFGRGRCSVNSTKWLLSEYKEPVKLSRLEYEILKWAKKEGYKYIARTSSNSVFVHTNKPNKLNYCWVSEDGNDEYFGMFNKFFQFVKWEDEEPRAIKDILENCVVVEDESK